MGFSKDYPNVPEWVQKDTGYHTGDMVKYQGNIFKASYWAGKEPGVDPGWALYDELYDLTPHTPTQQAKIIAYIPTWRKQEGFNYANDEMYASITHGNIAFLMFNETNLGEFDSNSLNAVNEVTDDVVSTGHRNGTQILISLGGATDYGFLYLMEKIGNNPSDPLLNQAVQNVVNFVKSNNLDGVDLDLECWWDKNGNANNDQGGRPTSKGAHPAGYGLTEFAKQLKQSLLDKVISATVFATSWYGNNYDPKMVDYLDWVGIMTYDLTGSWNASPVGPHTALYKIRNQDSYAGEQQGAWPGGGSSNNPIISVEDSLWYWTNPFFVNWQGTGQKIPRNKIVAGVPIYGYDFAYKKDSDPQSGQVPPGYKVIRYKDILSQFGDANTAANANIKVPGSTPRPPFISAPGNYPYAHNIYFETPETARDKLNFLKDVGAQGVIIWELSNEDWEEGKSPIKAEGKSIIQALYQNSGNPPKELFPPGDLLGELASGWSDDSFVPDIQLSKWPAAVVFKGKIYCVHEGYGDSGWLWYTSFDGNQWSKDQQLPNVGTSGTPALVVFNDKLYCFHQGRGDSEQLWYTIFDGNTWSPDQFVPDIGLSEVPAVAVFNGKIYCVHEGILPKSPLTGVINQGWLWYATFDGNQWSKDQQLPNVGTSGQPALQVFNGKLYCFHQGQKDSGQLWYTTFDGNTWSPDQFVPDIGLSKAPATVIFNGNHLQCVHEGYGDSGWLWYASFDGNQWSKDQELGGHQTHGTSGPPALVVFNGDLYCFHQGQGNTGKLWMSILTLPSADPAWSVASGPNSYAYCEIDSTATQGQSINTSQKITIEAGAPYLYAVLSKGDGSIDFPLGAMVTIQGSDGTIYNQKSYQDNLFVQMSDDSLQILFVKDPILGDWVITLKVFKGVDFRFVFQTLPAREVSETIEETLVTLYSETPLQKRGIDPFSAFIEAVVWEISFIAYVMRDYDPNRGIVPVPLEDFMNRLPVDTSIIGGIQPNLPVTTQAIATALEDPQEGTSSQGGNNQPFRSGAEALGFQYDGEPLNSQTLDQAEMRLEARAYRLVGWHGTTATSGRSIVNSSPIPSTGFDEQPIWNGFYAFSDVSRTNGYMTDPNVEYMVLRVYVRFPLEFLSVEDRDINDVLQSNDLPEFVRNGQGTYLIAGPDVLGEPGMEMVISQVLLNNNAVVCLPSRHRPERNNRGGDTFTITISPDEDADTGDVLKEWAKGKNNKQREYVKLAGGK